MLIVGLCLETWFLFIIFFYHCYKHERESIRKNYLRPWFQRCQSVVGSSLCGPRWCKNTRVTVPRWNIQCMWVPRSSYSTDVLAPLHGTWRSAWKESLKKPLTGKILLDPSQKFYPSSLHVLVFKHLSIAHCVMNSSED